MGKPTSIRVGPHDWVIRWYDHADEDATQKFGWCQVDNLIIGISERLPPTRRVETLFHELIHALCWTYDVSKGTEEEQICGSLPASLPSAGIILGCRRG